MPSGGDAIATTSGAASASGQGSASGGDGAGGCVAGQACGSHGIGGWGGGVVGGVANGGLGVDATGWIGNALDWSQGHGGTSPNFSGGGGGAGGGGFGGGGVELYPNGGSAGGSYAVRATLDDSAALVLGSGAAPSSGSGLVVISFDVCSTYPTLAVCQP